MAATCRACDQPLTMAAPGNPRIWCSERCRARSTYSQRAASGRTYAPRSSVYPRECNECGRLYVARSPKGKNCSEDCAAAANRRLVRQKYPAKRLTEVERARAWRAQRPPGDVAAERDRRRQWRARVGYLACMREADLRRRASKAGAVTERFSVAAVYERDAWVCGICREPVDPALEWPDVMSASLDHIVPLSLGGSHTARNARLTHLTCNVRRGNRVEVAGYPDRGGQDGRTWSCRQGKALARA